MQSEEVQSVLLLVRLQIAALQRKANKTGPPTTNVYAQRLAKGLGEIEKALERPAACVGLQASRKAQSEIGQPDSVESADSSEKREARK